MRKRRYCRKTELEAEGSLGMRIQNILVKYDISDKEFEELAGVHGIRYYVMGRKPQAKAMDRILKVLTELED